MNSHENLWKMKIIWGALLLIVWEVAARLEWVSSLRLPAVSKVLVRLAQSLGDGSLALGYLQSVLMILAGLIISFILTLIIVYLDFRFTSIRALAELLSSVFHPLPGVVMLPVIMIFFGIGRESVLAVIIHAALWSMYLNLKNGISQVDESLIDAARNNGASSLQLYRYVLLTCAENSLRTGLQIGWSRGWRGLISAEMIFGAISAIGGVGWFMLERRAFMDVEGLYAGMVLVALTGVLVEDILFRRFQKRHR